MSRNMLGALAVAAMFGGYAPASAARHLDLDVDEDRVREARAKRDREHEELVRKYEVRRAERDAREKAERQRRADHLEMLRNGIEPTTGQPLSRQRRRALKREGFHFNA